MARKTLMVTVTLVLTGSPVSADESYPTTDLADATGVYLDIIRAGRDAGRFLPRGAGHRLPGKPYKNCVSPLRLAVKWGDAGKFIPAGRPRCAPHYQFR